MQRGHWFSAVTIVVLVLVVAALGWVSAEASRSGSHRPASTPTTVVSKAPVADDAKTSGHPLDPILELASQSLKKLETEVDDYTALLTKRERIDGRLGGETKMFVKIRTRRKEGDKLVRPLSVYLKFESPFLTRGREVIWVEDRNEGKLIGHEGASALIQVRLNPTDKLAMMGNKYPITEIGFSRLIEQLIEKGQRDRKVGLCQVTVEDGHKIGDRPCKLIQVVHPDRDPRFDFHIAEIFFDIETQIPLCYKAFTWSEKPDGPPVLEEEYTYTDVRLNVGLTDADFDPDNSAYHFK